MQPARKRVVPTDSLFDATALQGNKVEVHTRPFAWVIARDLLPDSWRGRVAADYPKLKKAGFFPVERNECGPAVNHVVDALLDPAWSTLGSTRPSPICANGARRATAASTSTASPRW